MIPMKRPFIPILTTTDSTS